MVWREKYRKKWLLSAFAVSILLCIVFCCSPAKAAGTNFMNAEKVELNKVTEDVITGKYGEYNSFYYFNTTGHDAEYKVKCVLEHPDKDLYIRLYNEDYQEMTGDYAFYPRTSTTNTWKLEKNKTYYIHIYHGDEGDKEKIWLTIDQKIYKPAKTKFTLVKGQKKSVKLKWKKAMRAKSYQVAVKKKGAKKWKYYTTTKRNLTIKKLASKKKYYIKVRSHLKNVENYYSKWSKVRTVKTK